MSSKNKKNRTTEATNIELKKQANIELEKQAILEIKRDAARGRERSKTMGTMGWQKPKISSINKRFLINTLNSARMTDKTRNKDSRNKESKNKDSTNKEGSSFALRSLQRTS